MSSTRRARAQIRRREKQAGRKAETIGDLADLYIEKWAKPRKRSWKADDNLLRTEGAADVATSRDRRHHAAGRAAARGRRRGGRRADRREPCRGAALEAVRVRARPRSGHGEPGGPDSAARAGAAARSRAHGGRAADALAVVRARSTPPMAAFYKLRLLTAQRGGEVASMRWQDVDLEAGWWTIPADAQQEQARASRAAQPRRRSRSDRHPRQVDRDSRDARPPARPPTSPCTCSRAPAASGSRPKRRRRSRCRDFRGHDLRRTAASRDGERRHRRD